VEALETRVAALETAVAALPTPTRDDPTAAAVATELVPTVAAEPVMLADGLELLYFYVAAREKPCRFNCNTTALILGEMRNGTDRALDTPGLTFTFLDGSGNVLGAVTASGLLQVMEPGQVMPFEAAITEEDPQLGQWDREEITLADPWGTDTGVELFGGSRLEIRDERETAHDEDGFRLEGAVYNGFAYPVKGAIVQAAIYDPDGRYAGRSGSYDLPGVTIPPGKTAAFVIDSGYGPFDPVALTGPDYTYRLMVGH
jgi:hypothetical protein